MLKRTQKMIISAFMELLKRKSLDKITVREVIESADINRNTFYYHFQDIYDLLDKMFKNEGEKFRNETKENSSFYEEYMRAARIILDNRQAIINIYSSRNRDSLLKYLEEAAEIFVGNFVRKAATGKKITDNDINYITHFYSYSIVGNTMHWVAEGMPEYREDIMKFISRSFEVTIDDMIADRWQNIK